MEKNEGDKFIKFSSKIDKQLTKVGGVQAKQKRQGKINPKGYLEDYSSAAWPSDDCFIVTPSAATAAPAVVPSGASLPTAPSGILPSPTISPMEDSKVKASRSSGEMEKVSKSFSENSKSDGRPKR